MVKPKENALPATDETAENGSGNIQTDQIEQIDTHSESKKAENPVEEKDGISVYLGPTIHGAIIKGAVFDVNKKTALERNKSIIEKYPLIAQLIVPGETLPEDRIKVKTPGNLLYSNHSKLAGMIKGGKANG